MDLLLWLLLDMTLDRLHFSGKGNVRKLGTSSNPGIFYQLTRSLTLEFRN